MVDFIVSAGMYLIAGGTVFMTSAFKNYWSQHYDSVENMRKSVETLKKSPAIHLPTLEYGRFQPILAPMDGQWPGGLKLYMREMRAARVDLTAQPNDAARSRDEPNVKPLTRCALLDATLRKCFNSEPPIPMDVDVEQKAEAAADRDVHSVKLVWTYKEGSDVPVRLHFTMICPYRTPKSNKVDDRAALKQTATEQRAARILGDPVA